MTEARNRIRGLQLKDSCGLKQVQSEHRAPARGMPLSNDIGAAGLTGAIELKAHWQYATQINPAALRLLQDDTSISTR